VVGHDGVNFSKGQAQRILLARSLYKEVDYYFLDEPFSALDRLTYLKVFKNMRDQLHDKTLLIVTHKMEVASKMDYIYLLEDGVLIESGTHEKLAALGQRYFNIFLSDEE
jgi:ABC-type transport system involved in cytochrome bd biosynthesis fused ATPase/permease subunit